MNRRTVTTVASGVAVAAAFLLPLPDFLRLILQNGGLGGIVWALVNFWSEVDPSLTGDQRYFRAVALAFVLPNAAVLAQHFLGYVPLTPEGVFAALGIAFVTASSFHRTAEKNAKEETKVRQHLDGFMPPDKPIEPPLLPVWGKPETTTMQVRVVQGGQRPPRMVDEDPPLLPEHPDSGPPFGGR